MKIDYVYCDSCVFLAYFKREEGRIHTLEQLFDEIQNNPAKKILTSVFSITEVAHVAEQNASKKKVIEPSGVEALDNFWRDGSLIEFVEFHEPMAFVARDFIRNAKLMGYSLKPPDAVHLASASYAGVLEFFTYDDKLFKLSDMVGCSIKQPYVPQPRLPI